MIPQSLSKMKAAFPIGVLLLAAVCHGQAPYPDQTGDTGNNEKAPNSNYGGNNEQPPIGSYDTGNYGSSGSSNNGGQVPASSSQPNSGYGIPFQPSPASYDQSQQTSSWGRQNSPDVHPAPAQDAGSQYTTTSTTPATITTTLDSSYSAGNYGGGSGASPNRYSKRDTRNLTGSDVTTKRPPRFSLLSAQQEDVTDGSRRREEDVAEHLRTTSTTPSDSTTRVFQQGRQVNGDGDTNPEKIVFVKPIKVEHDDGLDVPADSSASATTRHPSFDRQRRDASTTIEPSSFTPSTTRRSGSIDESDRSQHDHDIRSSTGESPTTRRPFQHGFQFGNTDRENSNENRNNNNDDRNNNNNNGNRNHNDDSNRSDERTAFPSDHTTTTRHPLFDRSRRDASTTGRTDTVDEFGRFHHDSDIQSSTGSGSSTAETPTTRRTFRHQGLQFGNNDDNNSNQRQQDENDEHTSTSTSTHRPSLNRHQRDVITSSTKKPVLESLETARFNTGQSLDAENRRPPLPNQHPGSGNTDHDSEEEKKDDVPTTTTTRRQPNRHQRDVPTTTTTEKSSHQFGRHGNGSSSSPDDVIKSHNTSEVKPEDENGGSSHDNNEKKPSSDNLPRHPLPHRQRRADRPATAIAGTKVAGSTMSDMRNRHGTMHQSGNRHHTATRRSQEERERRDVARSASGNTTNLSTFPDPSRAVHNPSHTNASGTFQQQQQSGTRREQRQSGDFVSDHNRQSGNTTTTTTTTTAVPEESRAVHKNAEEHLAHSGGNHGHNFDDDHSDFVRTSTSTTTTTTDRRSGFGSVQQDDKSKEPTGAGSRFSSQERH